MTAFVCCVTGCWYWKGECRAAFFRNAIADSCAALIKAVNGFLEQATADEQAYMNARLGENWREYSKTLQVCLKYYPACDL